MEPGTIVILALAALLALLIVVLVRVERASRQRERQWEPVLTGTFDRMEYGYYTVSERSGAMVHTTHYRKIEISVLYFQDGRTVIMHGRYSMPHVRGTVLRVHQNGNGRYRFEKLETAI